MDLKTNQYEFPFLNAVAKDGDAMAAAVEASGMTHANCRALVGSTDTLFAKLGRRRRYGALDGFFAVLLAHAKER